MPCERNPSFRERKARTRARNVGQTCGGRVDDGEQMGKLIQRLEAKHTHVEWLRFLERIDQETPDEVTIHVVADDYATHKHAKVRA